jgi:deoxyadenosine/deoxycytidine kinase
MDNAYIYLFGVICILTTVAVLIIKYLSRPVRIKIIAIEGKVGGGKTTLLRHLCNDVTKHYDTIIGIFYIDYENHCMYVEEPIHLYQTNGLLNICLEYPCEHEDVFQLSVLHIMHIHLINVLEFAKNYSMHMVVMERHISTVQKSFTQNIMERYPAIEMNLMTSYQIAVEDLLKRYKHVLYNENILNGCIYVDWATQSQLTENIIQRGRESELKMLNNQEQYSVNIWLEVKHRHMLEVLNIPIYYVTKKFNTNSGMTETRSRINNFLKHI